MAADGLSISPLVLVGSTVVVVWVLCSGALLKVGRGSKRNSKVRRIMARVGRKGKKAGLAWIGGLALIGFGFTLYLVHTQLIPLHILVGAFSVYDSDEATRKQNLKTGEFGDLRDKFKSWSRVSGAGEGHYSFWKSELLRNSGQYLAIGLCLILVLPVFGFVFFRLIGSSSGQYYHARVHRKRRPGPNMSSSARLPVVGYSPHGSNARMPIVPPSHQPHRGHPGHGGQRRGSGQQPNSRPRQQGGGAPAGTRPHLPTQPR